MNETVTGEGTFVKDSLINPLMYAAHSAVNSTGSSMHKGIKIDFDGITFDTWQKIGIAEGLASDAQIALFLMQQYQKSQISIQQATLCMHCHTSLVLTCPKCPQSSQSTPHKPLGKPMPPQAWDEYSRLRFSRRKQNRRSPLVHASTGAVNSTDGYTHKEAKASSFQQLPQNSDFDGCTFGFNSEALSASVIYKSELEEDQNTGLPCSVDTLMPRTSQRDDGDDTLPLVFESNNSGKSDCFKKMTAAKMQRKAHSRQYPCTKCETVFKLKQSLREHMKKFHAVRESFQCNMCKKSFYSHLHLKKHVQSHEKSKPSKQHFCSECDAVFAKAWDLKLHIRRHTNERPFVCSVCGSGFKTKDKLKIHTRCHTGERPYVCSQCGATFRQSGILQSHMRTHSGEKPYICKECGMAFAQSSALKTHMRIHTGEKSHMCTVCGVAFAASSRLDRHMRVHTNDRPYICSECGSGFKSSRELVCHSRTHTKYKPAVCKVCGSSFSQVGYLKIHMRIHTGEKPYVCEVCSMAFRQLSGLKMHMLKHTDEKPCVCNICEAAFRRSDTLKNHMLKKHSDNDIVNSLQVTIHNLGFPS